MLILNNALSLDEIKLTDKQEEERENYFNPPREISDDYIPFTFQGVTWKTNKNELNEIIQGLERIDNTAPS